MSRTWGVCAVISGACPWRVVALAGGNERGRAEASSGAAATSSIAPASAGAIEPCYLAPRSAALASRAARNSESWLQFGQRFELARSLPRV
ncbi:hypothetical protein [Lysobacter gummosus]|uniref:hypothetical protein n=1 Tax=Lysobacter gummosus TaxID=262324 RepID=UPI003627F541